MSHIVKVNPGRASRYDVVFIHGLDGDGVTTWTEAKKLEESWLAWLAADFLDLSVWSLTYDIRALSWRANTMPLQDRATNILELLLSHDLGTHPLAFVCHSYGGLLVKQMLRNGSDSNEPPKLKLVENTQGVVFLATPHTGSDKATWFTHYAGILSPSVSVAELQARNAELRDLNQWYRNNAEKLGIATAVLFETKPTKGIHIVDQASADPGIRRITPIPVDANHTDICKPKSRETEIYVHVRRYLRNWFSPDLATTKGTPAIITRIDWGGDSRPSELQRKFTVSVASSAFPDGDAAFPHGSLLSSSDGAVSFALRKPSVALRAAIEFMQGWHAFVLKGSPDCRAIIDEGAILDTNSWRFIGVNETSLHELANGCVYVSEAIVDGADPTMAAFSLVGQSNKSASRLFRVEFEDPRTVRDSSLIHAFFVAHPAAQSVRVRLIELFLIEYVMENGSLTAIDQVVTWLEQHHYPEVSPTMLVDTLTSSEYFDRAGEAPHFSYTLRTETRKEIETERTVYTQCQIECLELVRASLREVTDSEAAVGLTDLQILVDEYLSAVFFEIRLMANYLRRTDQIFESSTQTLRKFDHIINRRLKGLSEGAAESWRTSFIRGLKRAAELKNAYVAAIFHNVLATYYLNRSQPTARYQRERLKGRTLYVDTNVLYAVRVGASSYHEISMYLLTQLRDLGFDIRIFPFSIREYENSLRSVDRAFHSGVPEPWVIENNPWIYQEFRLNHAAYFTFSACREVHSITKLDTFSDVDYDRMDQELAPPSVPT